MDGVGWGGMGWDEMGWDGRRWDGMGWDGIWDMGYGIWDMGYGIWDMGYGIWDMGYGIWDMGYGTDGRAKGQKTHQNYCLLQRLMQQYDSEFLFLRHKRIMNDKVE